MLDENIVQQLREVFGALEASYTLSASESSHEKQTELLDLLRSFASASDKIDVVVGGEKRDDVRFELLKDGAPSGVSFRGIPGGHEFTSLVLAVLNADGKGKQPDAGIKARIRALKGPFTVRTYVQLSCTNCPDVVQALNLIALLHPEGSHEMVDGDYCPDEVQALNVQGVPAVFVGDDMVHSGKSSIAELLEVLEGKLGRAEGADDSAEAPAERHYDVVIVGGGPAGAAAAIYSARKGMKTAIVAQRFGGQLQETLGIENLIGTPYTEGPKLSAELERHVRGYPVDILEHRRVERVMDGPEKTLMIQGGERILAPALIVATGAKWRELGVPGEREHIGRGVAFCPHCDGPFYKERPVAVIGGGNSGIEAAIDLAGICSHVTVLEYAEELKADSVLIDNLKKKENVKIITSARTTEVLGEDRKAVGLRYEDRKSGEQHDVSVDGIFVQIGLSPNSAPVSDLLELNRMGEIVVDERGRTSVPGIYAAGDVTTTPFKQIVIAMGEGSKAALTAFEDRIRAGASA